MLLFYIPFFRLLVPLVYGFFVALVIAGTYCVYCIQSGVSAPIELPVVDNLVCISPKKSALLTPRQWFVRCALQSRCCVKERAGVVHVVGNAAAIARCAWLFDCLSLPIESYVLTPLPSSSQYRLRVVI